MNKIDWGKLPEKFKENETIKQFVIDHGFELSGLPFYKKQKFVEENRPAMANTETLDSSNFLCSLTDVEEALAAVFGGSA